MVGLFMFITALFIYYADYKNKKENREAIASASIFYMWLVVIIELLTIIIG